MQMSVLSSLSLLLLGLVTPTIYQSCTPFLVVDSSGFGFMDNVLDVCNMKNDYQPEEPSIALQHGVDVWASPSDGGGPPPRVHG